MEPKQRSDKPHHYNPQCVYVTSGVALANQIYDSLNSAIQEFNAANKGVNLEPNFRVNVVSSRPKDAIPNAPRILNGFSYVWFEDVRVANLLVGKTIRGEKLVELIDDPSWSPPDTPTSEPVMDGKNWADFDDEYNDWEIRNRRPKIEKRLPPILLPKPFRYTAEQKERVAAIMIEDLKKKGLSTDDLVIPDEGMLECVQAWANSPPPGKEANVLFARQIPDWVTEDDIKAAFIMYVSNPEKKGCFFVRGQKIRDTYPFINYIRKNRGDGNSVFIVFDPVSNDALFAYLMMRRSIIYSQEKDENSENFGRQTDEVVFDYAFRDPKPH